MRVQLQETYFRESQVIGMSIFFDQPTLQTNNETHHFPHILPPLLLPTKSANWSIGVHWSHPTQRALPTAPLIHRHRLQPSVITSPPSVTLPTLSPASLQFVVQLPSPYPKADAPRVAFVPLHPRNYCLTADCHARPQLPCFLHTSPPAWLSCRHHPSRLHWPISDYPRILSCWRSLGHRPIHPSSRFSPGEFSSCLIINGNLPVKHYSCSFLYSQRWRTISPLFMG